MLYMKQEIKTQFRIGDDLVFFLKLDLMLLQTIRNITDDSTSDNEKLCLTVSSELSYRIHH